MSESTVSSLIVPPVSLWIRHWSENIGYDTYRICMDTGSYTKYRSNIGIGCYFTTDTDEIFCTSDIYELLFVHWTWASVIEIFQPSGSITSQIDVIIYYFMKLSCQYYNIIT